MDPDSVTGIKMPQQQTQPAANAKPSPVLAIVLTGLALLLPLLGLAVLHIFAAKSSSVLPFILANLFLLLALILCWVTLKKRGGRNSIPVIIAAVIGIAVYIFLGNQAVNNTSYDYSHEASQFSTVQAGGMTFLKPSQFTSTGKKSGQNYSTESFAHLLPSGYPVGYIFTFSYKDSHTQDPKYISGVNDFMDGRVNNNYRTQYIDNIQKQVFDSYPGYSAMLGGPQKFTNANIKKNAWSFALNVTSNNQQVKPLKGKLIYILGNGTIYYFALMVTDNNWTPNTAIWQSMFNSLKL